MMMPKAPKVMRLMVIAIGILAASFAAILTMNRVTDERVPVSLAPGVIVTGGVDLVTASGTWTRESEAPGSAMGFPIQTSRIYCYRERGTCIEATASLEFGNQLDSDLSEFQITSWTPQAVEFKGDYICATETYRIDLIAQTATGVGTLKPNGAPACASSHDKRWRLQLSDGFKVYWEERRRHRPWLLRVAQSMFGN